MTTLHITRGIPASGKTTWAKAWVSEDPTTRARVNRDDLRNMLFPGNVTHQWDQEEVVTDISHTTVRGLLKAGKDVVVDDTNLRPKYVRAWLGIAAETNAQVAITEFPCHLDEAIERDAARANPVGGAVIKRMWDKNTRNGNLLQIPDKAFQLDPPQPYTHTPGLPPAIIVDIDGTLALMGDRNPYDLSRVKEDRINEPVLTAVLAASMIGHRIIFCSGRDETARADTEEWLAQELNFYSPLLMRAAGDTRKDAIVKRELFETHIRGHFNVDYVLDDRNQVVDMWRSLGLACFQVAPGDF